MFRNERKSFLFVFVSLIFAVKISKCDYLPSVVYYAHALIQSQMNLIQNKNTTCYKELEDMFDGVENFEPWALQMIDATAKLQSGLLMGNAIHVGNFDECLAIRGNSSKNATISGKYCSVMIDPTEKLIEIGKELSKNFIAVNAKDMQKLPEAFMFVHMYYGICVPDSCNQIILQDMWNDIKNESDVSFEVTFYDKYCAADTMPTKFTFVTYFAIAFFVSILIIIIASTAYDYFVFRKKKETDDELNVYVCYSLYTNWKRLFSLKTMKEQIKCLNGLRVVSMMWVVLGHRFATSAVAPNINYKEMYEWRKDVLSQTIIGASVAVDSFLLVTGLLIVYLFLIAMDMGLPFILPLFYMHRFVRMWPALAVAVLYYVAIVEHLGTGPFWPGVRKILKHQCEEKWWSTLMFINNYVHPMKMCVGQAWYLAVDMQLYVLSPLFLYPLIRWPKKAIIGATTVMCISMAYTFIFTWASELGGGYLESSRDYFIQIYEPTHVRMTPWLVGAIFGYYMHKYRNTTILLSRSTVIFGWIASMGLLILIVYGQAGFADNEYNAFRSASFNAFARPAWAVGLCWIIFACHHGYGGPVNWFLTLPVFTVLVRLCYSIFLTHISILAIQIGKKQSPDYMSKFQMFHLFWGDFVFTLVFSIIFTLAFESPIILLEKVLIGPEDELLEKAKKWTKLNGILTKLEIFVFSKPKEEIVETKT